MLYIFPQFGNTPLIFAAKQKKLDVVKTLVGNGHADVNVAEEVSACIVIIIHSYCDAAPLSPRKPIGLLFSLPFRTMDKR